jgi:hypothetical protein
MTTYHYITFMKLRLEFMAEGSFVVPAAAIQESRAMGYT